jgi:hypothetical protein
MCSPDRSDLHPLIGPMRKAGQQNAVIDAGSVQLGAGLCD